jgi:hypothetical protein
VLGFARRIEVSLEESAHMKRVVLLVLTVVVALAPGVAVWAFNCPVVIKQAEDLIKKAEAKVTADTKSLVDEAKKMVAEAKGNHENAKTKRDHADAVRKAKVASAFAEEAITLQSP